MKNYLVTGGAGFIGANLANKLIEDGNSVYIIDNLSTGFMKNVNPKATFIEGCVSGDDIQKFATVKFDAIFHLAGQSSGEISFSDPLYDLRTNTQSTLNLLEFSKQVGCKKFIYASTMSVYGEPSIQQVAEEMNCIPKSFYGVGKLASEHYLRICSNNSDIKTVALRLFSVYGPGQNLTNMKQGILSIYLSFLLNKEEIHVKGSGERFRDLIYVDDVVSAFIKALDSKDDFNVYNVGTSKKTTIFEMLDLLKNKMGQPDYPVRFDGSTSGDVFGIHASIDKIAKGLNWAPKVSIADGVSKFVDWALLNK